MRRLTGMACVCLVVMITAGAGSSAVAQTSGAVRVAVMNFENNSTWSWWGDNLGRAAADEMTTQLFNSGRFSVIERSQLDAILSEQDLGTSGLVTADTAARIGQLLGVQLIVTGSITQFSIERTSGGVFGVGVSYSQAESKLDVRLVDTTTGEIMMAETGEGSKRFGGARVLGVGVERQFDAGVAQEALRPAIENVVEKVTRQADRFSGLQPVRPTGQVVGLRNGAVYINRGQNFNVQPGERFEVRRVIDEITDADGTVLDQLIDRVGIIEVTQVLSQSAICQIVEGEAAEGDAIQGM